MMRSTSPSSSFFEKCTRLVGDPTVSPSGQLLSWRGPPRYDCGTRRLAESEIDIFADCIQISSDGIRTGPVVWNIFLSVPRSGSEVLLGRGEARVGREAGALTCSWEMGFR